MHRVRLPMAPTVRLHLRHLLGGASCSDAHEARADGRLLRPLAFTSSADIVIEFRRAAGGVSCTSLDSGYGASHGAFTPLCVACWFAVIAGEYVPVDKSDMT